MRKGSNMKKLFHVAVLTAFFYPNFAISAPKTGNELLAECSADQNTAAGLVEYLICAAYISGVREMYDFFVVLDMSKNFDEKSGLDAEGMSLAMICAPEGSSEAQAIDIIVAYLKDNPADRHKKARYFVIGALVQAWPCELKSSR